MGEHENGVVEATATEVGTDVERHEPVTPPTTLFRTDDPVEVVERASRVADALKGVLDRQGLTADIQGKRHVLVEGWTTLGAMVGVTAVPTWTSPLEGAAPQGRVFGWEARVEARTLDGRVIGAAEAMCTRDERRWKSAEDYALRSMAQTRATSKALRGPLGFVVTLAGYQATPAEEMPADAPAPISEGRARELYDRALTYTDVVLLQRAVTHVAGVDPGDLTDRENAIDRLTVLSVPHADRLAQWIETKAAKVGAA